MNGLKALLFGRPPSGRRMRTETEITAPVSNGVLHLLTEDGKLYVIGRDFLQGETEIFLGAGLKISSQPVTILMDILCNELGTLNLLDYEAFFLFTDGKLLLDQRSPGIREEIQRLSLSIKESQITLGLSDHEGTNISSEDQERLKKATQKMAELQEKSNELAQVKEKIKEFAAYEKFLSQTNRNALQELSEELTAIRLERRYYEGQCQQTQAARETIEREIMTLKKKIASFDQKLFSEEFQEHILELARIREEKNAALENLHKEYQGNSGGRRFFRRGGRDHQNGEEKIGLLLKELSDLKKNLEELLKGKTLDQYLKEVRLYKSYLSDLWHLENRPVGTGTPEHAEKLKELIRIEEEVKSRLEKLLAQAGSIDLKRLKEKVAVLRDLKIKEAELSAGLTELLGEETLEERLASLEKERLILLERQQKEKKKEEIRLKEELLGQAKGVDPVYIFQQVTANYLARLTDGRFSAAFPIINEGRIELQAAEKKSGLRSEESLGTIEKELLHLAFRLALASYRTPAKEFPLVFVNPFSKWDRESRKRAYSLLRALSENLQIILLLDGEEELSEVAGDSYYQRLSPNAAI